MDLELKAVEYKVHKYSLKLYVGGSKQARAILFKGLTYEEAEQRWEEVNLALGHTEKDEEGDLIVLSANSLTLAMIEKE